MQFLIASNLLYAKAQEKENERIYQKKKKKKKKLKTTVLVSISIHENQTDAYIKHRFIIGKRKKKKISKFRTLLYGKEENSYPCRG